MKSQKTYYIGKLHVTTPESGFPETTIELIGGPDNRPLIFSSFNAAAHVRDYIQTLGIADLRVYVGKLTQP